MLVFAALYSIRAKLEERWLVVIGASSRDDGG
jgi:hypothetical protein